MDEPLKVAQNFKNAPQLSSPLSCYPSVYPVSILAIGIGTAPILSWCTLSNPVPKENWYSLMSSTSCPPISSLVKVWLLVKLVSSLVKCLLSDSDGVFVKCFSSFQAFQQPLVMIHATSRLRVASSFSIAKDRDYISQRTATHHDTGCHLFSALKIADTVIVDIQYDHLSRDYLMPSRFLQVLCAMADHASGPGGS